MALRALEHRQSPGSDDPHNDVPEREQEVQSRHDCQRRNLLARTSHSKGSNETEGVVGTPEAPRMYSGPDSKLMDGVAAPQISSKGHSLRASPPLWKIWWLEVACTILSIIFFSVIITVLYKYDQASIPRWRLQITLNSLVAFFTTLAKASFMIPVSVAISQTQWSWFRQDKPLYDLHVLDQASRGFWGSFVLLTRVKWRHFVVIGALLTIISALTSPITQLAISYPVRDVLTQEPATVSAVHAITFPEKSIDRRARNAIVLGTISNSRTGSLVTCATGNCTFNQFESLGICMEMKNVTSRLRIEKFENPAPNTMNLTGRDYDSSYFAPGETIWKASMPDGKVELIHQTGIAAISEMLNWNDTSVFRNSSKLMQTRIASVVLIYTTPTIDTNTWQDGKAYEYQALTSLPRHEAVEIIFHMCVQSFETKVHMGEEKTDRINSVAEPLEQYPPFELKMNCSFGFDSLRRCDEQKAHWNDTLSLKGSLNIQSAIPSANFTADYHSMMMIAHAIKLYLNGYERAAPSGKAFGYGVFFSYFFSEVLFLEQNIKNTTLRNERIRLFYERVAVLISDTLREVKDSEPAPSFNLSGMAWREEAYVQVRWGWITFLAIELLTAAIFLCITIITQPRHREDCGSEFRDLKDSALALVVALSDECRVAAGGGLQHMDELKRKAMQLKVRFEGNKIVPAELKVR